MQRTKFYVTTPIYYVNDKPHIGHAYTTILADVLARYHRLLGVPTYFLTGTDEHGQKVQKAADGRRHHAAGAGRQHGGPLPGALEEAGDHERRFHPHHRGAAQEGGAGDPAGPVRPRRDLPRRVRRLVLRAGERFFTEKDLVDGKCPECDRPVEKIKEANYFFRMSKYQDWLIQYIQEHPKFIQPDFRRNETLGFLRKPLNDLCISRPKSRMSWGIELPFDTRLRHLRLVRRAGELHQRRRLPERRRASSASGGRRRTT